MNIIEDVRSFLVGRKYLKNRNILRDEDSILEKGIIDSAGMVELISFIESKYGIKIDEEELMPENFDSLELIGDFVERKIG